MDAALKAIYYTGLAVSYDGYFASCWWKIISLQW